MSFEIYKHLATGRLVAIAAATDDLLDQCVIRGSRDLVQYFALENGALVALTQQQFEEFVPAMA